MPIYTHCPHCEHPQVITARRRGRAVVCRQCGEAYKTFAGVDFVRPLPTASYHEPLAPRASGGKVYVIEV